MRRVLILVLVLFITISQAFAYDLILPRDKKTVVSSKYAFFVGKAKNFESILINGERIYTASNGAFAHSVKLKEGENRIVIKTNYKTQVYKFYKTSPQNVIEDKLCEYDSPKTAKVIKNNTPLRSTPVDAGLNRIAHLFKGTTLMITGEKGSFYRVFLSKNDTAWISKDSVNINSESNTISGEFITTSSQVFKNARVQNISFTKNLPYTIEESENEILFSVFNPEYSENSVYKLNIPKPEKYSYNIDLNDGCYSFKVRELPKTPEEITIAVDAGHGGRELGAVGCLGDCEKDINLKIALELKQKLEANGFNVVMTRECDANISLQERIDIAQQKEADLFVSIHLNSIPDIEMNVNKNKGTSVYYYNKNSRKLAESVRKSVIESIGTRNDGLRSASFAVIRPTNYIGILVETAYMTNPNDSVLYTSSDFAKNTAIGITNGILNFIYSK